MDSVASALAAEAGGADRLELCDDLAEGGTTPSAGMIEAVKERVKIPVFVIIRPRAGGFVYSPDELDVMRRDIVAASALGVDGFVLGVLTRNATIDVAATARLVASAEGRPVTFHRAFDLVMDQNEGIENLVRARVARVLTSGGAATASEGTAAIKRLIDKAADRLVVVAGGGIREPHAADVVRATGVREIHVRLTQVRKIEMATDKPVGLRRRLDLDDDAWEEFSEARLRALIESLGSHPLS